MPRKICIVDDDPAYLQDLKAEFAGGYEIELAGSASDFWRIFAPNKFALIVLDMRLDKEREGLTVLRQIQAVDPFQAVVVATAYADTETYLEVMQAGALLYVDKAKHSAAAMAMLFDAVVQQGRLRREQAVATKALERMDPVEIIGTSDVIRSVRADVERLARHVEPATVIVGELGSGRELVARSIHLKRQGGQFRPLVTFNPQDFPEADLVRTLIGSDGHTSGRRGLLADAHGTGLIVRNAERLPADVLSLIIESWARRSFRAGGGIQYSFESSLYFICEDPTSIEPALQKFRRDRIVIPPLRDRKDDIALLASYFLDVMRRRGREDPLGMEPETKAALLAQEWPGNVTELKATLEYAAVRAAVEKAPLIAATHLPDDKHQSVDTSGSSHDHWDLEYQEARLQISLVNEAMIELATTNKTKLASFLRVNTPTTLSRRVERSLARYPVLTGQFPRVAAAFIELEARAI